MAAELAAARDAIRELVARYHQLGDAGRLDELLETFSETAVLEVDGRVYAGRSAIREMFAAAAAETREGDAAEYIRHFVASHSIEPLGPGRARGRSYFQVLTERGLDHWGRYRDEYVLQDGRWRFARRRVVVDGRVPGGWAERASARLERA